MAGRLLCDVQDWFATFENLGDCFATRAALFRVGGYAPLAAAHQADRDLIAVVRGITRIYATDPDYDDVLLRVIGQPEVQAALSQAREEAA